MEKITPIHEPDTRAATTTATDESSKGHGLTHRQKEVSVRSIALVDAVAKDAPDYRSSSQLILYAMMCLCVMNGVMNGFDGSVMSSINVMAPFQDRFEIGTTGVMNGLVFSIYTAGNILGSLACGYIMDRWGRRASMFSAGFLVVLGSVLQATSFTLPQFIVGRIIVGLGNPMASTAAPVFLVEIAYPTWRGRAGGLYNTMGWAIGSNMASWSCYGTNNIQNDWCWRIPLILQCLCPAIVMSLIWLCPESPRWLFAQRRVDEARAVLVKYHGNGNADSALVGLEMEEMREAYEVAQEIAHNNWNYKILIDNRSNLHRIWLIALVAVFSQFIGGSVISYYLPVIVNGIGFTNTSDQLLINGINSVISFIVGVIGSFFVDKIGRRPLFLWGTFLTGLVYIPLNVLAARAEEAGGIIPKDQGFAFVAMIYVYGIFWSFCWTPLQALYPAEVLNNQIRAKGMGAQGFISGCFSFINTFGTSVSLKNIGWKTYTIFLVLHFVLLALMWLSIVETKDRTLEELEEIFNDPHPVKRSKEKTAIIVTTGVGVKVTDGI